MFSCYCLIYRVFQIGTFLAAFWVLGLLVYRTLFLDFYSQERTEFPLCSVDEECFQLFVVIEVAWAVSFLVAAISGRRLVMALQQQQENEEVAEDDEDYVDDADIIQQAELVEVVDPSDPEVPPESNGR